MIHMTTKDSKIEKALSAKQKGSQLQELEQEETYLTSKMLEWLMPWLEKTDEESTLGFWQDTLPTTMMVKLLEVWLTEKSRLSEGDPAVVSSSGSRCNGLRTGSLHDDRQEGEL